MKEIPLLKLQDECELVCDEKNCMWTYTILFEDIETYHNKACPSCKKGCLINDKDLEMAQLTTNMVNQLKGLTATVPDAENAVTLIIDTASLRN